MTSTISPTATIVPKPGDVMYQADWTNGANGWPLAYGWNLLNGQLVNDGTATVPGDWNSIAVIAPYRPQVRDYAVEIEIQVLKKTDCGGFGLVAREGYNAAFGQCGDISAVIRTKDDMRIGTISNPYDTKPHTFRFEVRANSLKVTMDGASLIEASDNRYLTPGTLGMYADRMQVNVRSFKVIAL